MTRLIHTGIIGFGLSGKVFHAPFIHTHPGFHLSSVVERRHQNSKEIYPYVSVVNDYHELLLDDSIELVVIATPNIYHFPMARDCLMAGKHVVIEKPFTPTSNEANELIGIANKQNKKIFVYHNRRWDGDFLTIEKLLEEGLMGDITYYEAHFDRYSPTLKPNAWRDENVPGGGNFFDLGSHLIDQALLLFGMPEALRAELKTERLDGKVDDYFKLELFYPDKNLELSAGMLVKKPGPRYLIRGTEALFTKYGIDPQEQSLKSGEMPDLEHWGLEHPEFFGKLSYNGQSEEKPTTIKTEAGNYMAFYDNVYEVLIKNKPMAIPPQAARDVIFIIEKGFESHQSGRVVDINKTQQ